MKLALAWIKQHREILIVSIVIVATAVLYNANFFIAEFTEGMDQQIFVGTVDVAKGDKSVYFSMIEQVRQEKVLVNNLYTSEQRSEGLFHPLWLVLGTVARVGNISSIEIFFWSKFFSSIGLLYFVYWLSCRLWQQAVFRLLTVVAVGWFAGLGRIVISFVQPELMNGDLFFTLVPADLWFSEAFGFLTLAHSPLFIVSQLLMLACWWGVYTILNNSRHSKTIWWVAGGLVVLSFIHPFDAIAWWAVTGMWVLLRGVLEKTWERVAWLLPPAVGTLGVAAYYLYVLLSDLTVAGWHGQNIMQPPSWYSLVTGLGVFGILAVAGLYFLFIKKISPLIRQWFIAWVLVLPLLMYMPIGIARRLVSSWGIGMAILSVFAFEYWWQQRGRRIWQQKKFFSLDVIGLVFMVLLLVITPIYQVAESIHRAQAREFPEYRSAETLAVMEVLAEVPQDAVIMAPAFMANIIPSYTARRVWLGHDVQTLDFEHKHQLLNQFYDSGYQEWMDEFLTKNNIDYVVWPTAEVLPSWEMLFWGAEYVVFKI